MPSCPNCSPPRVRATHIIAAIFRPRDKTVPTKVQKAPLASRLPKTDELTRSQIFSRGGGSRHSKYPLRMFNTPIFPLAGSAKDGPGPDRKQKRRVHRVHDNTFSSVLFFSIT